MRIDFNLRNKLLHAANKKNRWCLEKKKNPYSCNSLRMGNKNEFKFKKTNYFMLKTRKIGDALWSTKQMQFKNGK
jgi:hypothetical protein